MTTRNEFRSKVRKPKGMRTNDWNEKNNPKPVNGDANVDNGAA